MIYVSPDEGNLLASFGHQSEYDHHTTTGTHLLVAWTYFNQLTDGEMQHDKEKVCTCKMLSRAS
jgi:hypothetical protein